MRRRAGFTLWELVIALGVAAVLIAVGAPSLETFVLDNRRTAVVNAFVTAVQLARSEAAKRGRPVVLCQTADTLTCGDGTAYQRGWMVFVNLDGERPPARRESEPLLLAFTPRGPARIHSNRRLYEFRPFRRRSTNGTITFCDRRGATAARAVIISYTARPRVDSRSPGGRALACPPLP